MKFRVSITVLLACFILQSFMVGFGRLRRGFEALEIYNYFKAKELFYKELDKNKAGAAYGLSIIYGRNDNPFYKPDSAYYFVLASDTAYGRLDEGDREKLAELPVDSSAIAGQKRHLDSLLLEIARKKPGAASIQHYLDNTVNTSFREKALAMRNKRAFEAASYHASAAAYLGFMNEYPRAAQVPEAKRLYQKRLYQEKTAGGTLKEFQAFVDAHPSSPYREQAEYEAYRKMTAQGTLGQYRAFVKQYPENSYAENAWRQIYALEVPDFNPKSIAAFTLKYPNYPFLDELREDFRYSVTNYFTYSANNQWGFIDEKGTVRIKARYDWCEPFSNGLAMVGLNEEVGFVDKRGNEIVDIQYKDASNFSEGYAAVQQGNLWGFVNRNGDWLVKPVFQDVGDFTNGFAYAEENGTFGYINAKGSLVIPAEYNDATDFEHGTAVVEMKGLKGIIDTANHVLASFNWDWTEPFDQGLARVRLNDQFGLLTRRYTDSLLIPVEFQAMSSFHEGLALLAKDGKYGFADTTGAIKIKMKYDFNQEALSRSKFKNGYAWVTRKNKVGVIDTAGNKVYPFIFQDVGTFAKKRVPVKRRGKWGYANREVDLVIPYDYQYATAFKEGMAQVKRGDKWGLIDTSGQYLVQPAYAEIESLDSNRFLVKDTLWGVIDSSGQVLVPFRYSHAEKMKDGIVRFTRQGSFDYYEVPRNRFIWKEE